MTARTHYWYVNGAKLSISPWRSNGSDDYQSLTIANEIAQQKIDKIIKEKEAYAKRPFWFSGEPWK